MKKFYFIFPAVAVLAVILVKLPLPWFATGMAGLLLLVAWQFYATRLHASQDRTAVLEENLDTLNQRLDEIAAREERARREIENIRQDKQRLLAVISHEVRTPMNGIVGSTLLLEDSPLAPEQRDHLATIRHCSENLMTTVNAILVNDAINISKIQQSGEKLEYLSFDLRNLVEEVLGLFADRASESRIELLYTIDPQAPATLIGDEKRIRQVLVNLVENALKFTEEGDVVVTVNYYRALSSIDYPQLRFEIRDTGSGMTATELKKVLSSLTPGNKKASRDEPSGQGLVICKKLATLMGGGIEAISEKNLGSTFIFHLPITPSMKPSRGLAGSSEIAALEGKKVLVVTYNATRRSQLETDLAGWKMKPLVCGTAEEALRLAAENPDTLAVLLELCLPDMDGSRLAAELKTQIPGVSLVGMKYQADQRFVFDARLFTAFLTKPIRLELLRQQLVKAASPAAAESHSDQSQFATLHPMKLLLVEDNPVNQKIGRKILSMLGYDCTIAGNGKEAVDIAQQEDYDLILMDVQMPEMDGLEATRILRTCLTRQPVIIAMTANVMEGDRNACMQAGMDDYMSKPIDINELISQLDRWYRARSQAT